MIVDNGSGTGEGERLAAEFGVQAVSLSANGGVSAGYNAAIRWARDQGATHVLLANNDLEFEDPTLVGRLAEHVTDDVAAIGPIVRRRDGTIASAGTRIRRWQGRAVRMDRPRSSVPYDVDALDGSCLLVSIKAACRIGGLAPEYFLYWEENEWCDRARRAGLRLLVDPNSSVVHTGGSSGSVRQTRRYSLRNALLFIRRNVRGPAAVTASMAWLFARVPWFVVRRLREGGGARDTAADLIWALRFHVRDIASEGWRRAPIGPDLCAPGEDR